MRDSKSIQADVAMKLEALLCVELRSCRVSEHVINSSQSLSAFPMRRLKKKSMQEPPIELARALLNETRVAIVNNLLERPKYISDLARALDLNRAALCYHLNFLESLGVIKSEYVVLQEPRLKGKMGRVYSVNLSRLKEALQAVHQRLPKIEV